MQVAAFTDVHGDLTALRRVWDAIDELGYSSGVVLNAGDNVGYGSDPEGCIHFLRERPQIVSVRGNYDKHVAAFPNNVEEYKARWGKARPDKLLAIRRDSDTISSDSRVWLQSLPRELTIPLVGGKVMLTHYAPGCKEALGPWTATEKLAQLGESAAVDVVVCGHTHVPFVRMAGTVLFVNPGSVGRSPLGHPSFAVITLEAGQPSAEVRMT